MNYEVSQHGERFYVEAIDFDGEGEIFATVFIGSAAEERAKEFADWKNKAQGPEVACRILLHSWMHICMGRCCGRDVWLDLSEAEREAVMILTDAHLNVQIDAGIVSNEGGILMHKGTD